MRLTNKLNLPDAICRAVANDSYTKGDAKYSVTELISPPRKVALTKMHWENLEEDVSDRIWSLFGQAMHVVAERANKHDVAERVLFAEIDGVKIKGGMDLYCEGPGKYIDYKTCSVYKVKEEKTPEEWVQQINLYAVILRLNKVPIKSAQVLAIVKDWRPSEWQREKEKGYPDSPVQMIDIPLWSQEKALAYMQERIRIHEDAEKRAKESLPDCTPEDRWERDTTWAIKKIGGKIAVAGHASYKSANDAAEALSKFDEAQYFVEFRPGKQVRCERYCTASKVCTQYQNLIGGKVE